jgi:NADP-dependent 3-hydroxy acid dehydrogenase YdfG
MYHCLQLVLPHMVARRAGNVVNISSVTFHLGMGNMTVAGPRNGGAQYPHQLHHAGRHQDGSRSALRH